MKNELLNQLNANVKDFLLIIENIYFINHPNILFGSWYLKDIVAHIVGWDNEVLRQFELFKIKNVTLPENDIDKFNVKSVNDRISFTLSQNIVELKNTNVELNNFIKYLTEEEYNSNKIYNEWLEVEVNHYKHHTLQLKNKINNTI